MRAAKPSVSPRPIARPLGGVRGPQARAARESALRAARWANLPHGRAQPRLRAQAAHLGHAGPRRPTPGSRRGGWGAGAGGSAALCRWRGSAVCADRPGNMLRKQQDHPVDRRARPVHDGQQIGHGFLPSVRQPAPSQRSDRSPASRQNPSTTPSITRKGYSSGSGSGKGQ